VAALDLLTEPWRTAVPYLGWVPGTLMILVASRRMVGRPAPWWAVLPAAGVLVVALGALAWSAEWDRWRILLMQSVIFAVGLDGLRGAVLAHARQRPVPLLLVAGSVTMVAAAAMRIGVTLANPEATYAFLAGMVSAVQKGYLLAWLATLVLLGAGAWQAAAQTRSPPSA
jgi:hypothetical protein